MKLIHGRSIQETLREISPVNIAVAYVGIDWRSYIDVSTLKDIVLSPTIGTNPFAVARLAKELGWDNVHFLDNLHTKVYLGTDKAAVGSFNLTANGLSAEGLEEAGVVITERDALNELSALLERYKELAKSAYPTTKAKRDRLAELRATWDRGIKTGTIRDDSKSAGILDYVPVASNEVYVCWVSGEMEYSEQVLSPATVGNSLSFLETDIIEPDRWILCWFPRSDGKPDERRNPYWLHIDEVIPNGAIHDQYTKAAIERTDRATLQPPFELTDETIKAIRAALGSGRFPEFLGTSGTWSIDATLPRLPEFIECLRTGAAPGSNSRDAATAPATLAKTLSEAELRRLFQSRVQQAMDLSIEKKYVKQTIHGMLASHHAVEVAKKLVRGTDLKAGLRNLAKANALHLSFESIMLEPQFAPLFSKNDLQFASWNLLEVHRGPNDR